MKTEIRKELRLSRPWRCGDVSMKPGNYVLGGGRGARAQISTALARRAVAEGVGFITTVEMPIRRRPMKKGQMPENKAFVDGTPENKSALAGVRGGGKRAKPDEGSSGSVPAVPGGSGQ